MNPPGPVRGVVTVLALVVVLTACARGPGAPISIPPQDPELVELGETLYQANCAECHGSDLRGTDQGPSHLSIIYNPKHHADEAFLLAVQRGSRAHHWGFGNMPPVPGLTPDDVSAIVAYVREQQRLNGFEPYPP